MVSGQATYVVMDDGGVSLTGTTDTQSSEIVIPDSISSGDGTEYKVRKIAKNAFKNNKKIKTVKFGKYIEVVDKSAFENCTSLKTVVVSNVLRIIESKAFYNCKSLVRIRLPMTIEKLGTRCFANCKKLQEADIGVKSAKYFIAIFQSFKAAVADVSIGAYAFENCASLRKVIINVQVRVIGNSAFSLCKKLASIIVYSKKLKTVGNKALKGVHDCKIKVLKVKLKPYKTLFKNKGQGKKVVVSKM